MKPVAVETDMTVDEMMRRWPKTITLMIRRGMLCVGCPVARFHTIRDACLAHGIVEDDFLREVRAHLNVATQVRALPAGAALSGPHENLA